MVLQSNRGVSAQRADEIWERYDASRLSPAFIARINRILTALDDAADPEDMDFPGFRLHLLRGNQRGFWSVRVSRNWRITFRFHDGAAVD